MNEKSKKVTVGVLMLLFASVIWGFAFVAQTATVGILMPFGCGGVRFFIGALVLIPSVMISDKIKHTGRRLFYVSDGKPRVGLSRNELLGGLLCGVTLFLAVTSQQYSLELGTGEGKAAFLTAMYIVIIPIIGIFFGKRAGWNIWVSVLTALAGAYLLSIVGSGEGFSGFGLDDAAGFMCALLFAFQMVFIERFGTGVDPLRFCIVQFLTVAILSLPPAFLYEHLTFAQILEAGLPMLYLGVLSCACAYTLQVAGQQRVSAVAASLICCLESVFAAFGGFIFHGSLLGAIELGGCGLILVGVILSQIPFPNRKKQRTNQI